MRKSTPSPWNCNPWTFHLETLHTWWRRRGYPRCKCWFQSVQYGFSPNRRNIKTLWLFWLSCPVLTFLSRSYAQVEPLDRFSPIFTLYGSHNVFPRKDGPFLGVRTTGKYAPKTLHKWLPKWNPIWLPAVILKNRYDALTPPTIITLPLIVRLLRNLASRCKMTCRYRYTRQNRNRK